MFNLSDLKSKYHTKSVIILLVGTLLLVFLASKYTPPLSTQEIYTFIGSKSLLTGEVGNQGFLDFAKSNGFLFSPLPVLINYLFISTLPHSFILSKIPSILLLFMVLIVYKKLVIEQIIETSKLNIVLPIILLVTSPWLIQAAIYNPSNLISLGLFVASVVYLKKTLFDKNPSKKDKHLYYIFLTLLSLSSIQGLISSVVILAVTLYLSLKSRKLYNKSSILLLLATFLVFGNLFVNRSSIVAKFNQGSIFTKITLTRLAQDIDERQKIDFLSSNKNFILPPLLRKFTYNKLALATDRVIRKSISLIDFEQFSSPNESYDIVKLSGLLPKGNLPLYYDWEIPIIFYGAFVFFGKRKKDRKWFLIVIASSIIPALIFEKRDFHQYGIFSHAPLFILTIHGTKEIAKTLKAFRVVSKAVFYSLTILILLNYLDFLNLVYKKQSNYLKSNTLQHQQIADWVHSNKDVGEKIVITNRFGPTQLAIPAYLGLDLQNYWQNYDPEEMAYQNLSFTSFDLVSESPLSNYIYIGFPGEFTGPANNRDIKTLPNSLELLDTLKSEDESVYQYGRDIWVVKAK